MPGFSYEDLQKSGAKPLQQGYSFDDIQKMKSQSTQTSDIYQKSAEANKPFFPAEKTDTPLEAGAKSAGNLLPSAYQFGKGIYDIARHPIDTAKSVYDIAKGTGQYVAETLNDKRGMTTPTTPELEDKKNMAKALGQSLLDRYGSLDALSATATNDPFGFGTDVLSIVEGGAGLIGKTKALNKGLSKVAKEATDELSDVSKLVKPKPKLENAVGQVLQGETSDIKSGIETFKNVDTQGVKKFSEVSKRIDTKIKELARDVDADLASNQELRKLDDLIVNIATPNGTIARQNYVEKALNHLSEMYEKIGDFPQKAIVDDLTNKAKVSGLTNKEINDLARKYGRVFKKKAFDAKGDPLTSVNAQLYENVRSELKSFARQGIGGKAAKAKDELISHLYNTKTLIDKNVESVNKLAQKAEEMGLGRKAVYEILRLSDKFTMGAFRGVRDYFIQSNIGRKTMNWLDVERNLEGNIKKINDAINRLETGKARFDSKLFNSVKGGNIRPGMSIKEDYSIGKNPLIQEARKSQPNSILNDAKQTKKLSKIEIIGNMRDTVRSDVKDYIKFLDKKLSEGKLSVDKFTELDIRKANLEKALKRIEAKKFTTQQYEKLQGFINKFKKT